MRKPNAKYRQRADASLDRAGNGRRGGVVFMLLAVMALLGSVAVLAWIFLLPGFIEETIRERTGLSVRMQRLVANPFTGEVVAQKVVVANPDGFSGGDFMSIREIRAAVDVQGAWQGRCALHSLELDIERLMLAKDAAGRSNIDQLRASVGRGADQSVRLEGPVDRMLEAGTNGFSVKMLRLRVDRVAVLDAAGGKTEFEIAYEKQSEGRRIHQEAIVPLAKAIAARGGIARDYMQAYINPTKAISSGSDSLGVPARSDGSKKAGDFWDGFGRKK